MNHGRMQARIQEFTRQPGGGGGGGSNVPKSFDKQEKKIK